MTNWSYTIVDTRSGVVQAPVFPAALSFSRAINSSGSGQATFVANTIDRALLTPWARTLVVSRNGVAVGAGIITKTVADFDTNIWSVYFADIRTLLGRRTTFGTNGYSGNTTNNDLPLSNQTLESMPGYLVWAGTAGATGNFDLPIYLPEGKVTYALVSSLPHAGTDNRRYFDYEVQFVEDALEELQGAGLEIDFEPQWVSGAFQWLLRVGYNLTGSTYEWNMSVPKPGLFSVKLTTDAAKQSNILYSIGKGSEKKMRVSTASASPTAPALERAENYKNIADLAVLQTHADKNLALYNKPTQQWELSVMADNPGIDVMRLGSTLKLYFSGHPMISDGWKQLRMIGFSADATETVKLTVQPIGA